MFGMEPQRYFIKLAYDGTRYHGWQIQKNAGSVQQVLTDALSMILRLPVKLTGAGRTDAGVHAREYYAHFDLPGSLSVAERKKLVFKLNSFLPDDLAIYEIIPVLAHAHARFTANSRTYTYHINTIKDPFLAGYSFFLFGHMDLDRMNAGADVLLATSDFTSFTKADSDTKTNICKVTFAKWEKQGSILIFTITADRFLRNMVRAVAGTLLDLGKGRITMDDYRIIIISKNRSDAGESVPACGLFLEKISYPEETFLKRD
jgi:tRNA pseudouridine38-40 synthase